MSRFEIFLAGQPNFAKLCAELKNFYKTKKKIPKNERKILHELFRKIGIVPPKSV